ncbi:hypothetical protein [Nocardia tenerifensis]|uniref:hypothetical protein n=1 Tax=Nocardia tenerifensis TaxID=228006 RepID=UPI00031E622E|nr:hypothetical protein [Nocardia tenerifensis]
MKPPHNAADEALRHSIQLDMLRHSPIHQARRHNSADMAPPHSTASEMRRHEIADGTVPPNLAHVAAHHRAARMGLPLRNPSHKPWPHIAARM